MFLLSVPIYCKLERTCTKTIILFVQQNQTEVQTLGVSLRSIRYSLESKSRVHLGQLAVQFMLFSFCSTTYKAYIIKPCCFEAINGTNTVLSHSGEYRLISTDTQIDYYSPWSASG